MRVLGIGNHSDSRKKGFPAEGFTKTEFETQCH